MAEVKFSLLLCLINVCLILSVKSEKSDDAAGETWKKKDIRDYTDADVERLYEQWEEEDEDKLAEDELPEWKRQQPKIDLSQLNPQDPEAMLKMTKQGRTLMMFASVSGNPTEKETEQISQLWQSSLFNAHYDVQRYVVARNRVLLMLKDGSQAWSVKDFLVQQDRCELITIEGKDYPGKGSTQYQKADADVKPDKKSKKPEAKKSKSDANRVDL